MADAWLDVLRWAAAERQRPPPELLALLADFAELRGRLVIGDEFAELAQELAALLPAAGGRSGTRNDPSSAAAADGHGLEIRVGDRLRMVA